MPLAETLFLAFVVVAFVGYGLLLFTAWLMVEVLDRPKASKLAAPAPVEAERPHSAAA